MWFRIAMGNFLVAASIGVVLRSIYLVEIPFIMFKPLLHAHSHVAMLGWIFIALTVFLLRDETPQGPSIQSRRLLFVAQLAVVGMLLSFPLEGYGVYSITASSVHLIVSYFLGRRIWVATDGWSAQGSRQLARMAVVMMAISTLGVWAMGPILATKNFGTELYYWSIQFFLHFQFNGWFWFAALALWLRWAETHGVERPLDRLTIRLWLVSAFLTFALAIAWSQRHASVYAVNSVGVILQAAAGWRTYRAIRSAQATLQTKAALWAWRCVTYALIGMALKVLMQAAVAIPQVAILAFTVRNYVIGFIHLNMLGAISLMLFAMALLEGWFVSTHPTARIGLSMFTSGVLLSESLLFGQGTMWWLGWGTIPGYYAWLVAVSSLIPLGVAVLLAHAWKQSQRDRRTAVLGVTP
jgi:hypothetical protein